MAPPSDPHEGGNLFDMAKDGTTMPNDAGKQNLIPSVPRPDQIADGTENLGAADLVSAADNPTDISRRNKDIGTTGEVLTGTGDQLPAQIESKRLHMGANEPFSKGHDRADKHRRQNESDLERYAGAGVDVDKAPGEEELSQEEVRERRDGKETAQ